MDRKKALADSWDKNSGNWTRAVREGLIPSRKGGTDDAIVNAIVSRRPSRILDVGCGEGWLIRRVRELTNCAAVGIDGSKQLVEDARQADPQSEYRVTTYLDLIQGSHPVGRDFDVIVFNYSLFDEDSARLIEAVAPLLARDGIVIIQTLHPWSLPPVEPYSDGWRTESFAAFENRNWEPMPWYFRTMQSWHDVIRSARMALIDLQEPSAEPGGRPLSLIMVCALSGNDY